MGREPMTESLRFDGEVVAVTGGAQGIGRETCESFAALGADIAILDVAGDNAESTANEIAAEYGRDVIAVETDITSHEETDAAAERIDDEFGRLDVVVNNAGLWRKDEFLESDPENWAVEIDVCFVGTLNVTHSTLPSLLDGESGAVVNVISDSYKGNDPGLSVYGAAKAASASFTKTLAKEIGEDGVRVNAVSPGMTRTPNTEEKVAEHEETIAERMYSLNRVGEPRDMADAIVFLASDAASWVTGQVLSVNGGYLRG